MKSYTNYKRNKVAEISSQETSVNPQQMRPGTKLKAQNNIKNPNNLIKLRVAIISNTYYDLQSHEEKAKITYTYIYNINTRVMIVNAKATEAATRTLRNPAKKIIDILVQTKRISK